MKKKLLWGGGVVVILIIVILVLGGSLNFDINYGDKQKKTPADKDASPKVSQDIEWKIYTNKDIGYTVRHPAAWTVKETDNKGRDITIAEPSGAAFVRVRGLYDATVVRNLKAVEASIKEYHQNLLDAKDGSKLVDFKSSIDNNIGGFIAVGTFSIGDIPYSYEERGLISTNGRVIIMRAAAIPPAFEVTKPIMRQIMESFEPLMIE